MNATLPPSNAGIYVYCIVRAEPFGQGTPAFSSPPIGGGTGSVHIVQFEDIAAIVSEASAKRYDVSRQNTLAHELVIEEAMARSEVLPVRFSTVAQTDQQVYERLLKRKYGEFHYLLKSMKGRIELGLKVFWNRERLFTEIAAESERIRALRDTISRRPAEETRYERIELGQLVEEAVTRKRDREAETILDTFRPLAVEFKTNKILTDIMVLNAAFLVDRAKESAFDAAVNNLDVIHAGRLTLKYVGPVPPYNFVSVAVRWEEE